MKVKQMPMRRPISATLSERRTSIGTNMAISEESHRGLLVSRRKEGSKVLTNTREESEENSYTNHTSRILRGEHYERQDTRQEGGGNQHLVYSDFLGDIRRDYASEGI